MNNLGSQVTRSILFEDEFEYGIDPNTWVYDLGNGTDRGIPGWGNGELQSYTTENSFTENGSLIIEAREESLDNRAYTSSRMTTRGTVSFETGLLEVTAKMPEGKGLWPAIWLLGDNHFQVGWPNTGEIDIAELKGSEPSVTHTTTHWSNFDGSHLYRGEATDTGQSLAESFHVYGLEKTSTSLSWLLDGDVIYTQNLNTYPGGSELSESFYLLLNLAVGGQWWDGNPDGTTTFPARMEIDSVKISSLEYEINLFSTSVADGSLVGTDDADRFTISLGKAYISAQGAADQIILEPIGQWTELYVAEHHDYQGAQIGKQISITGKNRFSSTIDGGEGIDTITLSEGNDAFFYHDAFTDHHSALQTTVDHDGRTTVARVSNLEVIDASDGDDIIDLTSPIFSMRGSQITVMGGDGNDILWGNDGNDILDGGAGDDQITGGNGYNILSGGFGSDAFQLTSTQSINRITDFQLEQSDSITFLIREGIDNASSVTKVNPASNGFITEVLTFDVGTDISNGSNGATITSSGPSGTTGEVLKITDSSPDHWAYTVIKTLSDSSSFLSDTDKTVSLRVWSPESGTRILMKFEDESGNSNPIELSQTTTQAQSWEILTWDFEGIYNDSLTLNKAVLFINGGEIGDGQTYYFDDFTYEAFSTQTIGQTVLNELSGALNLNEDQEAEIALFDGDAFRLGDNYLLVESLSQQDISADIIQADII